MDANVRLLHEKVKQVKKNADLEAKYMTGEDLLRQSRQNGKVEGKAEGKAESILVVLKTKFDVPEELCEKIMCRENASMLDDWLVFAANATSLEDFNGKISE